MGLSEEAQEFNEAQKRYREAEHLHKYTAGRDHRELMDELRRLHNSIGFLIDTVIQWIKDEEKRREDEHRRSTYGMWDPQKYRTKRDEYSKYDPWNHTPSWTRHDPPVPPYDPTKDPDRGSFDEGVEDGKEEN